MKEIEFLPLSEDELNERLEKSRSIHHRINVPKEYIAGEGTIIPIAYPIPHIITIQLGENKGSFRSVQPSGMTLEGDLLLEYQLHAPHDPQQPPRVHLVVHGLAQDVVTYKNGHVRSAHVRSLRDVLATYPSLDDTEMLTIDEKHHGTIQVPLRSFVLGDYRPLNPRPASEYNTASPFSLATYLKEQGRIQGNHLFDVN